MAKVIFHSSTPSGLRLQALFSPIVSGSVSYGAEAGMKTASFRITIYQNPEDVFYAGTNISSEAGQVSYLRFGPGNSPWVTLGALGGPVQFTYTDLVQFHGRGAAAAAAVLAGNDELIGSQHGDYMEGYAGNDLLDGSGGADTLGGGAGNDTYIVDDLNDRVVDAAGGGYDTIQTSASFALAPDAEIEELKAASWASALSLTGNDFRNQIVGTSGNDQLDGKGGVDTMIGGAGDDLYIVDSALDLIREYDGGGHDTVVARVSCSLGTNLETLKATPGSLSVRLTGNELPNRIFGNLGANEIQGRDGNDRLYGDGGNDNLQGGKGVDALYGGLGNDSLYGGDGNDHLYGDVGKDHIDGGAGNDRLYGGTQSNKLFGQLGHDILYGGAHSDTLNGGGGNDRLYGDAGNDYLDGGLGKDVLSGGWGRDTFIFRSSVNAETSVGTITDFNVREDKIRLENKLFSKLGKPGGLNPEFFAIGSKAQDRNDHVIYDKNTGSLYYDPDGLGGRAGILFAKLKGNPVMDEHNFHII